MSNPKVQKIDEALAFVSKLKGFARTADLVAMELTAKANSLLAQAESKLEAAKAQAEGSWSSATDSTTAPQEAVTRADKEAVIKRGYAQVTGLDMNIDGVLSKMSDQAINSMYRIYKKSV